jgi:eukaryotic-like serine/threonine-protein kinase
MVAAMPIKPRTAKDVFVELVGHFPPDQWDEQLAQACGSDAELLQNVQALLKAHADPGSFLEFPAPGLKAPQFEPPIAERPGTIIGPYKLLEQIGEGGMGVVFMAEQTQPIQRKVALKIIKPGMDTQQVIARFEAERQALALMDHPNIARVLDAGTTESGRPYFVMELVHGVPVTDYCDRQRLSVRQRLELFVAICQAVQHAHQKGIIHRDLKPTNVLVAQHDGRPLVKVIDFGVAKATGQKLTDKTLFTGVAQLIGTPLYMSPEQAELNAPDVDTRSDIYSLGVLLYELLTGSTPFETERLKAAAFDEMRRIIREDEPPRPSTRISTLAQQAISTVSEKRNSDPRHMSRLFQGELDWIAMKTLEKDRNRRYETASALADDVERYLHDEPVQACPPSRIYRLRKFASRYRAGIAIVGAFIGLFALGTAISTWQAIRATRAEQQTKASEQFALKNSRRADAISDFLINAFRSPDPARDGRTVTMAELLDRAVKDVKEEFADDQRMQADLLNAIAQSYQGLGLYRESVELFAKVQELRSASQGPLDTGTIESMSDLASACESAGQLDKAISLREEILTIQQAHLTPEDAEVLSTTTKLAWDYNLSGQSEKALALFENVLRLEKAKVKSDGAVPVSATEIDDGPENDDGPKKIVHLLPENTFERLDDTEPHRKDVLVALHNLALAFAQAGRVDQAIPLYQQTLKLMKEKLGPDDPSTLSCMYNLAMAFKVAQRFDEAIPLFDETLRLRKEKFGPESDIAVRMMTCVGVTYGAAGNQEKCVELFGEVLRIRQAKLGESHPDALWAMWQYGITLCDNRHESEALPIWEKALALSRINPGIDHPTTRGLLLCLAGLYGNSGRSDDVISLFDKLLKDQEASHGPDDPRTLAAMRELASAFRLAGRWSELVAIQTARLERVNRVYRPHDLEYIVCVRELANDYQVAGRAEEALSFSREVLKIQTPSDGSFSVDVVRDTNRVGFALTQLGKPEQAEAILKADLSTARANLPPNDDALAARYTQLAIALLAEGKFADAEPVARDSLEIREKRNRDTWNRYNSQGLVGGALLGQKKYAIAEPLLISAYEGLHERENKIPAMKKKHLRESIERLVELYDATNRPTEAVRWQEKLIEFDESNVLPKTEKKTIAAPSSTEP